jgi:hypothetical protein
MKSGGTTPLGTHTGGRGISRVLATKLSRGIAAIIASSKVKNITEDEENDICHIINLERELEEFPFVKNISVDSVDKRTADQTRESLTCHPVFFLLTTIGSRLYMILLGTIWI